MAPPLAHAADLATLLATLKRHGFSVVQQPSTETTGLRAVHRRSQSADDRADHPRPRHRSTCAAA